MEGERAEKEKNGQRVNQNTQKQSVAPHRSTLSPPSSHHPMRTRSGATASVSMAPKKGATKGAVAATPARGAARPRAVDAHAVRGPKYSVLLPTYNERENVALVVSMLMKEMEAR